MLVLLTNGGGVIRGTAVLFVLVVHGIILV